MAPNQDGVSSQFNTTKKKRSKGKRKQDGHQIIYLSNCSCAIPSICCRTVGGSIIRRDEIRRQGRREDRSQPGERDNELFNDAIYFACIITSSEKWSSNFFSSGLSHSLERCMCIYICKYCYDSIRNICIRPNNHSRPLQVSDYCHRSRHSQGSDWHQPFQAWCWLGCFPTYRPFHTVRQWSFRWPRNNFVGQSMRQSFLLQQPSYRKLTYKNINTNIADYKFKLYVLIFLFP